MTICWREIIPVVKLAHFEAGVAVRVDALVCTSVCGCARPIASTCCTYVFVMSVYLFLMFPCSYMSSYISLPCPLTFFLFRCVCVCVRLFIVAKAPHQ